LGLNLLKNLYPTRNVKRKEEENPYTRGNVQEQRRALKGESERLEEMKSPQSRRKGGVYCSNKKTALEMPKKP